MSDDDQERFEDYLELERYIEELQAGKAAHLPQYLTPAQARIYRIAAQFCSASPGADEPQEQFVKDLEARLLDEFKEEQQEITEKRVAVTSEPETAQVVATESEPAQEIPSPASKSLRRVRFISRRAILTGGAVAAASLAIGTGVGEKLGSAASTSIDKEATPAYNDSGSYKQPWIVDSGSGGVPTTWHFVTTIAQLGNQAVQFSAGGVIGYVILNISNQEQTQLDDDVIAVSAACTHMGCIVQWQSSDRRFHCPCHNGLFTQNGLPDDSSPVPYLAALPRLHVKIENNNIYVEVPRIE
jgi:Rieske Fe-S protein